MDQSTVASIVRRGEGRISRRGYFHHRRDKFQKVHDSRRKLIWKTIYNFYKNRTDLTINAFYEKLKEI